MFLESYRILFNNFGFGSSQSFEMHFCFLIGECLIIENMKLQISFILINEFAQSVSELDIFLQTFDGIH